MGRTYVPSEYEIQSLLVKSGEFTEDQVQKIIETIKIQKNRMNQHAAQKRSRKLGFSPIPNLGNRIKKHLNEMIIREVKSRKLTHQEVGGITLMARTTITAIMNRKLNEVSIECLLRILGSLGIEVNLSIP